MRRGKEKFQLLIVVIAEYRFFPIRLMLIENVDLPQLWNIFNQVKKMSATTGQK